MAILGIKMKVLQEFLHFGQFLFVHMVKFIFLPTLLGKHIRLLTFIGDIVPEPHTYGVSQGYSNPHGNDLTIVHVNDNRAHNNG